MAARGNGIAYFWSKSPGRVKAIAYAHAEGSLVSREIRLGNLIDRFGVQAIFGRSYLGAAEINKMLAAQRIVRLSREVKEYTDTEGKINWVKWAQDDPQGAKDLAEAQKAAADRGLLDG